jgi:hypothetical protein
VTVEEMNNIRGELSANELSSAVVHGINEYMTFLSERGLLKWETYEQEHHPDSDVLRQKWDIAFRVALKYLRPEPPKV